MGHKIRQESKRLDLMSENERCGGWKKCFVGKVHNLEEIITLQEIIDARILSIRVVPIILRGNKVSMFVVRVGVSLIVSLIKLFI